MEIKGGRINMKVREFIQLNEDIDVYDDVCDDIAIAFCGAQELTEEGAKHFSEVLDYDITIEISGSVGSVAIVRIDDEDEKVWKRRLRKAKEFFYGAAGYIEDSKRKMWFK